MGTNNRCKYLTLSREPITCQRLVHLRKELKDRDTMIDNLLKVNRDLQERLYDEGVTWVRYLI